LGATGCVITAFQPAALHAIITHIPETIVHLFKKYNDFNEPLVIKNKKSKKIKQKELSRKHSKHISALRCVDLRGNVLKVFIIRYNNDLTYPCPMQ
jgi:hypothetical protein